MHRLIINKLGPIERCELECSKFMALTGFQASGKSTVAKAIFYFRTIKDDIVEIAKEQALQTEPIDGLEGDYASDRGTNLRIGVENYLRDKFLRTFGSSWGMPNDMYIEYSFTEKCSVKISLKEDVKYGTPNYIWIELSDKIKEFLKKKNGSFKITPLGIDDEDLQEFKKELYGLFDDRYSVVYIPAGRSMITLLSQQFSYIYAIMDDVQKRSLDSCTRDYLERILRIKLEFSEGLQGLMARAVQKTAFMKKTLPQALKLIKKILRGMYRYNNGEEQIVLDDGKCVKINFSSSGQQESVWILNLLFYYLLQHKPILFIIEEPESHLFPESQKYITELIALVNNCGHSVVLTTHSPYVLGTLNNLLYAYTMPEEWAVKTDEIIPKLLWMEGETFSSWFVQNGTVEDCMDSEIHMIQNERIDEISNIINDEFDRLLDLQSTDREREVNECL